MTPSTTDGNIVQPDTSNTDQAFLLKAISFTCTNLQLNCIDLVLIKERLLFTIKQTPNFFNQTPIMIDLSRIEKLHNKIDLAKLISILRENFLIPVGVRTTDRDYKQVAQELGLANQQTVRSESERSNDHTQNNSNAKESKTVENNPANKHDKSVDTTAVTTKVIDHAVRSGTQIYAKGGDLIINASVSHGAEVLADGNIHIYGTLHGRALAGAQGNAEARIYCYSLNAELIAIAGNYLVNEQIKENYKASSKFIMVSLNNQQLVFDEL